MGRITVLLFLPFILSFGGVGQLWKAAAFLPRHISVSSKPNIAGGRKRDRIVLFSSIGAPPSRRTIKPPPPDLTDGDDDDGENQVIFLDIMVLKDETSTDGLRTVSAIGDDAQYSGEESVPLEGGKGFQGEVTMRDVMTTLGRAFAGDIPPKTLIPRISVGLRQVAENLIDKVPDLLKEVGVEISLEQHFITPYFMVMKLEIQEIENPMMDVEGVLKDLFEDGTMEAIEELGMNEVLEGANCYVDMLLIDEEDQSDFQRALVNSVKEIAIFGKYYYSIEEIQARGGGLL